MKQEYLRTAELFEKILKEQGMYYALMFLYDMQYDRRDLLRMAELVKKKSKLMSFEEGEIEQ
jgi:hypothetical protein